MEGNEKCVLNVMKSHVKIWSYRIRVGPISNNGALIRGGRFGGTRTCREESCKNRNGGQEQWLMSVIPAL